MEERYKATDLESIANLKNEEHKEAITLIHMIIKLLKSKDKKKIFKAINAVRDLKNKQTKTLL